jgi:hypothetical protein
MKKPSAKKPDRKRSRPVQIYFYESEFADLAAIAERRGISKSEQVRRWVITVIGQYRSGKVDARQVPLTAAAVSAPEKSETTPTNVVARVRARR